jgi:hypothetical protein
MPVGAENVYIDSSFYDLANVTSGTGDAYSEFFLRVDDNIGAYSIPISYNAGTLNNGIQSISTDFTTTSGLADYESTAIAYNAGTTFSGVAVALIEYAVTTISGTPGSTDAVVDYFTANSGVLGTGQQHAYIDAIMGDGFVFFKDYQHSYWTFASVSGSLDYETHYTTIASSSTTGDYDTEFTVGSGADGSQNANVDSYFAGYVMDFHPDDLSYQFDAVCGLETQQAVNWETTVSAGAVLLIDYEVLSAAVASGTISYFDTVCGLVDTVYYDAEAQTISGTISYHDYDLFCAATNTLGFDFDVDLFPLKISNFSLGEDEYTSTSNAVCVDVTDDVYNVVTSGTYFILDDTVVSGIYTTYTGITDGYRMCYNPDDNYASFLGSDNGDVLERDYYLTSGYLVEYDNRTQDYGYDNQVVVRMTAENFASCPLYATTAYWFTTEQTIPKNLGASIVGVPWGTEDLSASITPDTGLAYLYGKTFRVEVNARDFAGNRMTPYIFEFRIEDEPN